ncbi:MAG: PepSY domain-containing protein, partial [Hyphomicrobium sp.]
SSQAANASDDEACTKAPKEQWQTIDQLTSKLVDQGYKVKKIEFEDGCAEAGVEDKDGKKAELKLDPVTAAVVKTER